MTNHIEPLIKNLDARKKTRKVSHYPTPGVQATEIMLAETSCSKSEAKVAYSHLSAIKDLLKK